MDDLEAALDTGGAAAAELAVAAMLESGQKVVPCPNCAAPLAGHYCAQCGQPADTHRRAVVHLLNDLIKDIASFDSRILRTIRALLLEPGELALAFRQGRTQRYVPPVRLYLFTSLIFFLTLAATHIAVVQFVPTVKPEKIIVEGGKTYAVTADDPDKLPVPAALNDGQAHYSVSFDTPVFFAREGSLHPQVPAGAIKDMQHRQQLAQQKAAYSRNARIGAVVRRVSIGLLTDPAALNGALTAWIPRALFLLLPLFALLLAAFYWRQRGTFYFVDHLVFSLGFHSFGFALLLIAAVLGQVVPGGIVGWLTLAALAVYLLVAIRRFYGQNWFWSAAKFASVGGLYAVVCVFPAMIGILIASVMYG